VILESIQGLNNKVEYTKLQCDVCGKIYEIPNITHNTLDLIESNDTGDKYKYNDTKELDAIFDIQEFEHIKHFAGYGAEGMFQDGSVYEIDICQKCLEEKLGKWIRKTRDYE
jgi:DNA-directed RNA polymerase subunit M/transcription elongation factor TFIIS